MRTIAVVYIFSFIFFSCTSNNKEITYHKNGKKAVEIIYLNPNDTNIYIKIQYYSDGKLKDSVKLVHGKYDGIRKIYDNIDHKYYFSTHLNGSATGATESYYENGKLYYKGQFKNGKAVGPYFYYYEDGHLETFTFYSNVGGPTYRRSYDRNGKLIKSEGGALVQYRCSTDAIQLGNPFIGEIDLAIPPNCLSTISKFESHHEDGRLFFGDEEYGESKKSMPFTYESMIPGKDTVSFHWEVRDTISNTIDSGVVIVPCVFNLERKEI